eukprot:scaffold96920_cov43-Phaeocystis_antarctica.AAC.2
MGEIGEIAPPARLSERRWGDDWREIGGDWRDDRWETIGGRRAAGAAASSVGPTGAVRAPLDSLRPARCGRVVCW